MYCRVPSFGSQPSKCRFQNALLQRPNARNLLTAVLSPDVGPLAKPRVEMETFVDVTEALNREEAIDQSGEGIFDVARAAVKLGKRVLPERLSLQAQKRLQQISKVTGKLEAAKALAQQVGKLATGPVGTKISNVLSEKFNKNVEWRPGFPNEAHLILPTTSGLTRANFCG